MTHRFYTGTTKSREGSLELTQKLWINDRQLATQILRVLRMRVGEELVLFDGLGTDKLYKIIEVEPEAVCLEHVTDVEPKVSSRHIHLGFSLLKKDKSEWVVQKATELGATHIVPIISDRTEKTGFDKERMEKIAVEASEQCGRSFLPEISEPRALREVVDEYQANMPVLVADMGSDTWQGSGDTVLVLVGPEGGWSENERALFSERALLHIGLGDYTLRAETAAITAVSHLSV